MISTLIKKKTIKVRKATVSKEEEKPRRKKKGGGWGICICLCVKVHANQERPCFLTNKKPKTYANNK